MILYAGLLKGGGYFLALLQRSADSQLAAVENGDHRQTPSCLWLAVLCKVCSAC